MIYLVNKIQIGKLDFSILNVPHLEYRIAALLNGAYSDTVVHAHNDPLDTANIPVRRDLSEPITANLP